MYPRKPWIALIAALALTLGLAACGDGEEDKAPEPEPTLSGFGSIVTQEMDFADFTAVEAANAFIVVITQSDSFSVTVRVDESILDLLDVSRVGDTLRLRIEQSISPREYVNLQATITMPQLHSLDLSGASTATVSGFQSSADLDLGLSGASSLDADLGAGNVDINASGASNVTLRGSAAELTIEGSGASDLDLADFTVDTAHVELSGASEATVNAQERIDPVDASGASNLRYLGDPALGDVTTSGGSTVDKIGD